MDAVGDIVVALGKVCVLMMLIVSAWWDRKDKKNRQGAKRSLYGGFTGFGGGCGGAGGGCSGGGGSC